MMTFKEFVAWCNARTCDGLWGFSQAITCIRAIEHVKSVSIFKRKREREWRKYNRENNIVKDIVSPLNRLLSESI